MKSFRVALVFVLVLWVGADAAPVVSPELLPGPRPNLVGAVFGP